MVADNEGFLYPKIESEKCTSCHLCERVCPVSNKLITVNGSFIKDTLTKKELAKVVVEQTTNLPFSYVTFLCDDSLRLDSTSGGFFTAIANEIIERGGKVYGVEVNDSKEIIHGVTDTVEGLGRFRGSKYVQSAQSGIFKLIKKDLHEDIWVLYTGTPCQVEGLKRYLGKEYTKLVTADIFCHGVGSPKYWRKYVEFMEQKYGAPINMVKFREKTYGYNSACMALYFENGKSSHKGHDDDLYWTAFSKFFIFRPSCYDCVFKTINHAADYSIGDFWDTSGLDEQFRNANGCSLILVHSEKGNTLLKKMTSCIELDEINLEKALIINGGSMHSKLITSSPKAKCRGMFMEEMDGMQLDDLVEKYIPLSLTQKIKCRIKPFLYKAKLLYFVKQLSRLILGDPYP